jgi:hypothetical protein
VHSPARVQNQLCAQDSCTVLADCPVLARSEGTFGGWQADRVDSTVISVLRANVLVVGPDDVLERLLDTVRPNLREPISRLAPGHAAPFPVVGECGTLIIEDVGALPLHDQHQLFDWMTATMGRAQIVSTAASALLPLVETGAFMEALYYRLNIICIDLTTTSLDVDGAWALGIAFREI